MRLPEMHIRALLLVVLAGAAALGLAWLGRFALPAIAGSSWAWSFLRPERDTVLQRQQAQLARADAEVVRTAAHSRSLALEATAAAHRSGEALQRVEEERRRVRSVARDSIAVQLTPGGAVQVVGVPPPVITRMRVDSTAIAALQTEVIVKDSLVAAQQSTIVADSVARVAAGVVIGTLERGRSRCGRRCGIVIGVVAVVAVGVGLEQLRRGILATR